MELRIPIDEWRRMDKTNFDRDIRIWCDKNNYMDTATNKYIRIPNRLPYHPDPAEKDLPQKTVMLVDQEFLKLRNRMLVRDTFQHSDPNPTKGAGAPGREELEEFLGV